MRYRDIALNDGLIDSEAAAIQKPYGEIVDTRRPMGRFEPFNDGLVVLVSMDHRGILLANEELDHAILPGLKAGRLPKRSTKFRILAWRHRAKHIPGRVELLEDAGYPRQCLEGRLQVVRRDQPASRAQFVNRKFHPKLGSLVLDDKQHLVMGAGQRLLRLQNLVELEIA